MRIRKFLLLITILSSLASFGQMDTVQGKGETTISGDVMAERLKRKKDSLLKEKIIIDQERIDADNNRNINNLLEVQKKREARQKRNAIVRIAIGISLLILLFFGLRRRSKK